MSMFGPAVGRRCNPSLVQSFSRTVSAQLVRVNPTQHLNGLARIANSVGYAFQANMRLLFSAVVLAGNFNNSNRISNEHIRLRNYQLYQK